MVIRTLVVVAKLDSIACVWYGLLLPPVSFQLTRKRIGFARSCQKRLGYSLFLYTMAAAPQIPMAEIMLTSEIGDRV